MRKVWIEILRRSAFLAGALAVASLGTLLSVRADTFWTVLGTILAPVGGVLVVLARAYFKHRGTLTVEQVDAEFDKAEDLIK